MIERIKLNVPPTQVGRVSGRVGRRSKRPHGQAGTRRALAVKRTLSRRAVGRDERPEFGQLSRRNLGNVTESFVLGRITRATTEFGRPDPARQLAEQVTRVKLGPVERYGRIRWVAGGKVGRSGRTSSRKAARRVPGRVGGMQVGLGGDLSGLTTTRRCRMKTCIQTSNRFAKGPTA